MENLTNSQPVQTKSIKLRWGIPIGIILVILVGWGWTLLTVKPGLQLTKAEIEYMNTPRGLQAAYEWPMSFFRSIRNGFLQAITVRTKYRTREALADPRRQDIWVESYSIFAIRIGTYGTGCWLYRPELERPVSTGNGFVIEPLWSHVGSVACF